VVASCLGVRGGCGLGGGGWGGGGWGGGGGGGGKQTKIRLAGKVCDLTPMTPADDAMIEMGELLIW